MPHMDYGGWWMGGMHMFWWLFWVALIVLFFVLVLPRMKAESGAGQATPLDILKRRYATGDISTEEYDDRKARLERD